MNLILRIARCMNMSSRAALSKGTLLLTRRAGVAEGLSRDRNVIGRQPNLLHLSLAFLTVRSQHIVEFSVHVKHIGRVTMKVLFVVVRWDLAHLRDEKSTMLFT